MPEILTEARALLEQNGLHKGSMYPDSRTCDVDGTGRVRYEPGMPLCLLRPAGSPIRATPGPETPREAIAALHETLRHRTGRPRGVGSWQDSSSRTLKDVLELIDDTVVRWNRQHAAAAGAG